MATCNTQANISNAALIPRHAGNVDNARSIAVKLAAVFGRHGKRGIPHFDRLSDQTLSDAAIHGSAIQIVMDGHGINVARMSRDSAHDLDEDKFNSWSAALRATSLVILMMLTLVLVSALFPIQPAFAQQACGDRTAILEKLAGRYSEKPQAMGLSANGTVIEVLVSSTGSWTILVNHPNPRLTCVTATGEHWEINPDVFFGPPA